MSHEATRPVRHPHRVLLAALVVALALASGCQVLGQKSASSATVCSDKVVQSVTTNAKVAGLWDCLSPDFQGKLKNYIAAGLFNTADDAVFVDPKYGKPPVIGTHLVGLNNGVAVYTVVVQSQSAGVNVLTISIWLKPSPKVDNLAITAPVF